MRPLEGYAVVLLVVAHPDDEIMFFSPLLEKITRKRMDIHLLSLSNGDADGLGNVRTKEFLQCASLFGIHPSNVEVVNHPSLQDGMKNMWPEEVISSLVSSKMVQCQAELVITFDEFGVSGHPNHIAVYQGVRRAVRAWNSKNVKEIDGLKLVSKNFFRKFSGPFDICFSHIMSEFYIFKLSPIATILGMMAHTSQFVWYRRLFVLFSSYTYVNSFVSILET